MNRSKIYFFLAIAICLAPYLILCLYIFPSGDDYSYAWKGYTSTNFWDTLIGEWKTWNGRYFSNFFVLINPITYGRFDLYRVVPVLLVLVFVLSQYVLTLKFVTASKSQAVIMSLCFLLIYLNIMPDLGEGIYWYTAAVTYFAPLLLFPLYLIGLNAVSINVKPITVTTLIVLQFVLTGFNEVLMLILTLVHVGFAIWAKSNKKLFWLLLLTQLFFSAAVYFAPGNEVRSSYFPNTHNVIHTIANGSMNTLRFSASLFFTPALWICILLFLKTNIKSKNYSMSIWYWIALFLVPQFIACAGPVWTTGIIGQHRTPNMALYFQLLVVFMFLLFEEKHIITSILKLLSSYISYPRLLIALAISFLFWGNGKTASNDLLNGEAQGFHDESHKRANKLESFSNLKDSLILMPHLYFRPKSIFIYDLSNNPKDWKNETYTLYYGLKNKGIAIYCKP